MIDDLLIISCNKLLIICYAKDMKIPVEFVPPHHGLLSCFGCLVLQIFKILLIFSWKQENIIVQRQEFRA